MGGKMILLGLRISKSPRTAPHPHRTASQPTTNNQNSFLQGQPWSIPSPSQPVTARPSQPYHIATSGLVRLMRVALLLFALFDHWHLRLFNIIPSLQYIPTSLVAMSTPSSTCNIKVLQYYKRIL
jgi:hypothetical protein